MVDFEVLLGHLKRELHGESCLWAGEITAYGRGSQGRYSLRSRAALTNDRLVWSPHRDPKIVLSMSFKDIVELRRADDGRELRFTTKPSDYPDGLLKYNPQGIVEVEFRVLDLSMLPVVDELMKLSKVRRAGEVGEAEQAASDSSPVEKTYPCPHCGRSVIERSEHSESCPRYLVLPATDPGPSDGQDGEIPMEEELDLTNVRTESSSKISQAIRFQIRSVMDPGEFVLFAVPATWRDQADRMQEPGHFQGVLLGTNQNLHFLYNPEKRSKFNDLSKDIYFPRSEILGGRKERTYLQMENGYRFKAPGPMTHHLVLALLDGRKTEFYLMNEHFDELLSYVNT